MLRSRPIEEVVVLGAGFSKAILDVMPTADELGQLATEAAGIVDAPKFADGRFEVWLSRLAELQPDLSAAQNSENNAKFTRLIESLYEVMIGAQEQVQEIPDWAARLMTVLHYGKSVVITFNYDTLVERIIESIPLWDFSVGGGSVSAYQGVTPRIGLSRDREGNIGWLNLIGDVPALPAPKRSQERLAPSFRLLKLHGSLNWFWVPGDASGATLNSWNLKATSSRPISVSAILSNHTRSSGESLGNPLSTLLFRFPKSCSRPSSGRTPCHRNSALAQRSMLVWPLPKTMRRPAV